MLLQTTRRPPKVLMHMSNIVINSSSSSPSCRKLPLRGLYRQAHNSALSFKPKPVKKRILEALTTEAFLECIQQEGPSAEPIHLIRRNPLLLQKRTLIDLLLDDPNVQRCVVDLEIGRYDKRDEFQQVQLPLAAYLEWLKEGREDGMMNGRPVYLAQWRGLEELSSLKQSLPLPRFLQSPIRTRLLDLYQASFFVGPRGAVTPLHHDPYINLFSLVSSSNWRDASKHFLILPPTDTINKAIRPAAGEGQANTSPLDFRISRQSQAIDNKMYDGDNPEMSLTEESPSQGAIDDIRQSAYGVTLRAGEMLLLPYKWWHRVENLGQRSSWTAGIGYWMRMRS